MVDKVTDDSPLDSEGRYVYRHTEYEGCTRDSISGELVAVFLNNVILEDNQHLSANEETLVASIKDSIQLLTDTTKGYFPPQIAQDIADFIALKIHALNKLQEIKIKREIPLDTRRVSPSEKAVWENFSYCANDEIYEP